MTRFRNLLAISLAVCLAGCQGSSYIYHSGSSLPPPMNASVLVMPPDVVISLLHAGDHEEPRADWSRQVRENLDQAIQGYMFEQGIEFVPYPAQEVADDHLDVVRLANVTLDAIELALINEAGGSDRLYSIGEGPLSTLTGLDADYLMVVMLHANLATGGRKAVAAMTSVLGELIDTKSAEFRIALFDMRDGQLKWANLDPWALPNIGTLVDADEEEWSKAINYIMSEMPL